MAEWRTFREEIESLLGSSQKTNDVELRLYANWCIRSHINPNHPREMSTVLTTDGSTQSWEVPADFLSVRRVEVPADNFLEEIQIRPGTEFYSPVSGLPNMYFVEAGYLQLTHAPNASDVLTLYYNGKHAEITGDTTVLTVADAHLEIIASYVMWRASQKWANQQAPLDSFKMGGVDAGNPTHNPYIPLTKEYHKQFLEALHNSFSTGNVEIQRPGRGA